MNEIKNENRKTEQRKAGYAGLYDKLADYCGSEAYPFHMPGHKRNMALIREMYGMGSCVKDHQRENGKKAEVLLAEDAGRRNTMPYGIDITEIDGFDNLHHAEGILLEAQERASRIYGAAQTFYLINGSTCGILAAIFACTTQRGKLLMARNCHKAVYHAVELRELETVYLYPETGMERLEKCSGAGEWKKYRVAENDVSNLAQINGSIRPEDVEASLQSDPQIEAVVITSPSYDGILSDVKKIGEIAHRYGVPLIVDEAHGAHFGFHPNFPENALQKGADIVIHSLHKTLPSLTQTALLHIGEKSTKWTENVKKYLDIFETSSPSYVFMAGMDQCMCLLEERGVELFTDYSKRLKKFKNAVRDLPHVHLLTEKEELGDWAFETDPGKLVIAVDGWNGHEVAEFLRREEYLEVEMEAVGYVIALTSIADTDEGFERLKNALIHIEERISTNPVEYEKNHLQRDTSTGQKETDDRKNQSEVARDEKKEHKSENKTDDRKNGPGQQIMMKISQAAACEHRTIDLVHATGEISGEYIYLYPPGIPLVVPGEQITEALLEQIREVRQTGLEIQGMRDYSGKKVDVCRKV